MSQNQSRPRDECSWVLFELVLCLMPVCEWLSVALGLPISAPYLRPN